MKLQLNGALESDYHNFEYLITLISLTEIIQTLWLAWILQIDLQPNNYSLISELNTPVSQILWFNKNAPFREILHKRFYPFIA